MGILSVDLMLTSVLRDILMIFEKMTKDSSDIIQYKVQKSAFCKNFTVLFHKKK